VRKTVIALAAMLGLAGCHLDAVPRDPKSRVDEIAWRPDAATARAEAQALARPLLLVLVAGAKDDRC